MHEPVTYLNVPKQKSSARVTTTPPLLPTLFIGRKYHTANDFLPTYSHGICADFSYSADSGGVTKLTSNKANTHAFLWDSDGLANVTGSTLVSPAGERISITTNTPVANNRFVLSNTRLGKPTLQTSSNAQQLAINAEFDYAYTADQIDARLGVLNLVESHCFLLLEDDQQHDLLNTNEQAVLFLANDDQSNAISPIIDASKSDETLKQSWQLNLSHSIPEQLNGIAMETLTVLEQYQTFFMQRELPFSDENIWTPACAPISWGWSMRIARRHDGEWGVARQKLLMPAAGHNGMEMPSWKNNSLSL
jgi:hypothetical protein